MNVQVIVVESTLSQIDEIATKKLKINEPTKQQL